PRLAPDRHTRPIRAMRSAGRVFEAHGGIPLESSNKVQDRSMYEPFPGSCVWNLSVNICIGMGGAIGEIDKANERLRDLAKQGEDAGTEAFFSSWIDMADGVIRLADEAAASRQFLSAAEKY